MSDRSQAPAPPEGGIAEALSTLHALNVVLDIAAQDPGSIDLAKASERFYEARKTLELARTLSSQCADLLASLSALSARWREGAQQAHRWAAEHDAKHDGANSHAFRKERRIWTTCADDLDALIAAASSGKDFTRGHSVPGVGHGDLPHRKDGDD